MRYFVCLMLLPLLSNAQFAPPAGQAGTTAMYKDSSAFINWATFCTVSRGLQDISNSSSGYPTIGDSSKAIGMADNSVVSLGDGGYAICTFPNPLANGPGPDFAVFENSFSDDYLEFGFVEASSDGINFFRFAATCNIQDTAQTGSFGLSDATLVNNLAGKYRGLYGVPFDLSDLAATPGIDVNSVTHIKIIDVVGSINSAYATYDKYNHKINDPWPTAFASGGFDLDAVGVIHDITNAVNEHVATETAFFPNPTNGVENAECRIKNAEFTSMRDLRGQEILVPVEKRDDKLILNVSGLAAGVYFVVVRDQNKACITKMIVTK